MTRRQPHTHPPRASRLLRLLVWGDRALFTRPELRVERVSYEVMTPAAARGILEAILWQPALRWEVKRIDVLRPIRWDSVRRNEVKSLASPRGNGIYIETDRTARGALHLRDVAYVIHARLELTALADCGDSLAKFAAMFERRARAGQVHHQPFLGCREFAAGFELLDSAATLPQPQPLDLDLGYLFHDYDYSVTPPRAHVFPARLVGGKLLVPRLVPGPPRADAGMAVSQQEVDKQSSPALPSGGAVIKLLADYHRHLTAAGQVAPAGYCPKPISFLVSIAADGSASLCDLRTAAGRLKVGRTCYVPQGPKRTSRIAANLLWDKPAYALGVPDPGAQATASPAAVATAARQHAAFVAAIDQKFPHSADAGLAAVQTFLAGGAASQLAADPLWAELCQAPHAYVAFKLASDNCLVCQRPAVAAALAAASNDSNLPPAFCLVSGAFAPPARLHDAVTGVQGASPNGACLVSFNEAAFCSHGRVQGENAPISQAVATAYTAALAYLLRPESRQKLVLGDTTLVFWSEQDAAAGADLTGLFAEPPPTNPCQFAASVQALFAAPQTGTLPPADTRRLHLLTLAGNRTRLVVRAFSSCTLADIRARLQHFFTDSTILGADGTPTCFPLATLLATVTTQAPLSPVAASAILAAATGPAALPATLLERAIRRCQSERAVSPELAALIKLVINRRPATAGRPKELTVSLDPTNTNQGYLLGRLFALFERTHEWSLGATQPGQPFRAGASNLRERFFTGALGTPRTVFTLLMKQHSHHLARLQAANLAGSLEKQVAAVMAELPLADPFPLQLGLAGQGLFAMGYYHQRQEFFAAASAKSAAA